MQGSASFFFLCIFFHLETAPLLFMVFSGIAVHPLMHLNELLHQTQPTDRSGSVSRIKKKAESSLRVATFTSSGYRLGERLTHDGALYNAIYAVYMKFSGGIFSSY